MTEEQVVIPFVGSERELRGTMIEANENWIGVDERKDVVTLVNAPHVLTITNRPSLATSATSRPATQKSRTGRRLSARP